MTLSVIVAGTEYKFGGEQGIYWAGHDGLDSTQVRNHTDRGPGQHGDSDRGWQLEPRYFWLSFDILGTDWDDLWLKREQFGNIWKRTDDPLIVRFQWGNRIRQIGAVLTDRGVVMPSTGQKAFEQQAVVNLRAHDPAFYDPQAVSITFSLSGGGTATPVPTPVPTPVGGSTIDQTLDIEYVGSMRTYPDLLRFVGPLTSPKLVNETTGEVLEFAGVIDPGDWIDVLGLAYGYRTVVDQDGNNVTDMLTDDSDLATWHIAPHPDAPDGINMLRATASGASADSRIELIFHNRYVSI